MAHNLTVLEYTVGTDDPKEVVWRALESAHEKIEFVGPWGSSRLLVAMAPVATKRGSLYMTDKHKNEGRFQGKVGLVLAMGERAFKWEGPYEFDGLKPAVNDWVVFRPADSWETGVNGVLCRWVPDAVVIARVQTPEDVY
jgi:hypothetical protein